MTAVFWEDKCGEYLHLLNVKLGDSHVMVFYSFKFNCAVEVRLLIGFVFSETSAEK